MPAFFAGHATHPDAHMALALSAAQVEARRAARPEARAPTLGWLYITDVHARQAEALLAELGERWPGCHWVGCVGVGVMACGTEYLDEPGLALMLSDLPAERFRVFNGRQPLGTEARVPAHTAQVHADPQTADIEELIAELAARTDTGYLFGGLASAQPGRGPLLHIADGVFTGGLSGVGFGPEVALVSRVSQGCQPVGPTRRVTGMDHNLVLTLDDQPALPVLLADLGLSLDRPREALHGLRQTLVGLTDPREDMLARGGQFGADTRVRHLIGIDPGRDGVAIADLAQAGQQLAFCRRDREAARRDLVRICAEVRDEVDDTDPDALPGAAAAHATGTGSGGSSSGGRRIAGAVYISCSGRGGPHFGAPSAEAQIVQHALGDVPWVGFFAGGEIARHHLYGYTGVLTVFVDG